MLYKDQKKKKKKNTIDESLIILKCCFVVCCKNPTEKLFINKLIKKKKEKSACFKFNKQLTVCWRKTTKRMQLKSFVFFFSWNILNVSQFMIMKFHKNSCWKNIIVNVCYEFLFFNGHTLCHELYKLNWYTKLFLSVSLG